jgi:hypothetical protein
MRMTCGEELASPKKRILLRANGASGVCASPGFTQMPRGGHFAALEEPDLLVEDLRAFFRPLWQ